MRTDWRAWYMEDRSLALLMALHPRLGRNSRLRLLDDNSLSLVHYARVCVFDFMSVCMLHLTSVCMLYLMSVCMIHLSLATSPWRASAPQWRWRPSFDTSDLPGAPCVSAWAGAQRSMLSRSGCCLSCAPPWGVKKGMYGKSQQPTNLAGLL